MKNWWSNTAWPWVRARRPKAKVKHGVILVTIALILFIWFGSAEADEGEMYFDVGPSMVGSNFSTGVMVQLNYKITKHLHMGLGYISPQKFNTCGAPRCEWEVTAQIYTGLEMVVYDPWTEKFSMGFGPYYFQNADRIGTANFRIGIFVEYQFTKRFGVMARHFSLAGSGKELPFCTTSGTCITNNYNTGQDSWFRAVWHF